MSWRRVVPFGILERDKPRHYREMMKIAWENKDNAAYAMRILKHGVCDGCSLGPRGLKDDVMKGTHLCLTRLNLLRLNTMGAMPDGAWEDITALRAMKNDDLRRLGRVPYPLLLEKGASGFRRVSWDEALRLAGGWLRETAPERAGYFVTSRGITNETYYVAQKLARAHGTNNVDLCSRLCHAPSVTALKSTIGYGAPTCSLSDFIGTDLLVLFGTDLANNQPVTTKYMHYAKEQGTRIVVINPVREPGLERYWIPSVPKSALWGTKLMDEFYQVNVGGDIAFILGTLKALLDIPSGIDRSFVSKHTEGWPELEAQLKAIPWDELERSSGLSQSEMRRFASTYAGAKTAVITYSMGLTQHAFGASNVRAIVDLALARGNVGREKTGIMPIRGHSGVQGGGECGVDPQRFPGGADINAANAKRFSELWGFSVPDEPGIMTGEMMVRADRGELDLLYSVGGNLKETMPSPDAMAEALGKVRYRIHQDIVLNTSSVLDAGEAVLVLPAQTRYEQRTGGTSTSTERRIRFTPEIRGPRIGEAMAEWEILARLGKTAFGGHAFDFPDSKSVRVEMEAAMPMYKGIASLEKEGDHVQWGGAQLCAGPDFPNMPDHKAVFHTLTAPNNVVPAGMFHVSTRRGKQFNSIVLREKDAQMGGARRDAVLMNAEDASRLGLRAGDGVVLSNDTGKLSCHVRIANVARRHVVTYWPEGNVLIAPRYDPEAGIPDYNAYARVERA